MEYGKAVELFLVNGTPESLVIAELMNWNGMAFKVPRTEFFSIKRDEFSAAGVYFLLGSDKDGNDAVYIGEAENVRDRLRTHVQSDKEERDLWTTVVFITGKDLDKAKLRYLEDRLVTIARDCGRYRVLTKTTYSRTVIKEAHKAAMEEFIHNSRLLLGVLGFRVLEPLYETPKAANPNDRFFLTADECYAEGMRTSDGFVVFKDATLRQKTNSSTPKATIKARDKALASGKVVNRKLKEDMLFSSPSAAASFIAGYSVSGPAVWKTVDGKTLKQIESEESKQD